VFLDIIINYILNMKIQIFPNDLVKRCVWDNYTYYVLGSEKEAERILLENNQFDISERDALVIGLLKVIETPNLIHRFNAYMTDFLSNKSITNDRMLKIRKKTLVSAIDRFRGKFPEYWKADAVYQNGINDLYKYLDNLLEEMECVEVELITDQFGTHEFLLSKSIKKLLTFNY